MFRRRKNILKQAGKRLTPDNKQLKKMFGNFLFNPASEQKHQSKNIDLNDNFRDKKSKQKRNESYYRDKLARSLNGRTEVIVPSGRIDILTNTQIIEVKHIKKWNAALGQIITYGYHYSDLQKRIHLFGEENSKAKIILIKKQCKEQNIVVTFEE
ncbi:MAG: hypothetical protein AAGE96_09895 [Cyanobacteria bacterium P01_G01_bin.19]